MTTPDNETIRVYWQPGCTSCLRTKEFLQKRGIPFLSRNVLGDEGAYDELARFGLKQVPIVTKGDRWADGQILREVMELVGLSSNNLKILPVAELRVRLEAVLEGTQRFLAQLPDDQLDTLQPDRPRSYRDLVFHIFNIGDAFLEHEAGIPLVFDAYNRVASPDQQSKAALSAYGRSVQNHLTAWFEGPGKTVNWGGAANVYYGKQSLHDFLERTTWHSGQHSRQLMWALECLDIAPDRPLGQETFNGLPMPESVWEDVRASA
jgi:glutaredoxin